MLSVRQRDIAKKAALRLIRLQVLVTVVLAFVFLLLSGVQFFYSALLGGLLCGCFPSYLFTRYVFRDASAQAAAQTMQRFYVGQVLKLVASGVLFISVIKYLPVNSLALLIGLAVSVFAVWLSPLAFQQKIVKV